MYVPVGQYSAATQAAIEEARRKAEEEARRKAREAQEQPPKEPPKEPEKPLLEAGMDMGTVALILGGSVVGLYLLYQFLRPKSPKPS